jgi:hypothetical protein
MKKLCFFLIGLLILSCSKEDNKITSNGRLVVKQLQVASDRLAFQSMKEYNDTYLMLAKLKSKEELSFWAQSNNHSTLLNSSDSSMLVYSDVFKTILNKDYEFELGDSIVLFNNGDLYAYSKNESNQITLLKNPEKFNKIGSVIVTILKKPEVKSVILPVNTLNADYNQMEFTQMYYQPCGEDLMVVEGSRKYVHEILDESTVTYPGPVYYSYLYLRIKLEYYKSSRPNRGWNPAGEQRTITVSNLSGSAYWYPWWIWR